MRWLFFLVIGTVFLRGEEPSVVYLTWAADPTTTMAIHWHGGREEAGVFYRQKGQEKWEWKEGLSVKLQRHKVWVWTAELGDLLPGGEYEFRIEKQVYSFQTLPAVLEETVTFVVGGDAYFHLEPFRSMNAQIAKQRPDFVVVGGDIAYTHRAPGWIKDKFWPLQRWQTFFTEWKKACGAKLIPLVPVIGNHDVSEEGLFYTLFAFPEPGMAYRVLDIGEYLSLFLLDTAHSCPIEGAQTQWLKAQLAERERRFFKMAAYHVAGYPSFYPYMGVTPQKIRAQWSPVFDRYGLQCAFEHHNHAYKRTFPIRGGVVHPEGVVYLGDGSWGVPTRKTKEMWYLSRAEQANAVCVVRLSKQGAEIQAIDATGKSIDTVQIMPSQRAYNRQRALVE